MRIKKVPKTDGMHVKCALIGLYIKVVLELLFFVRSSPMVEHGAVRVYGQALAVR